MMSSGTESLTIPISVKAAVLHTSMPYMSITVLLLLLLFSTWHDSQSGPRSPHYWGSEITLSSTHHTL
jgi:hypothetical protein